MLCVDGVKTRDCLILGEMAVQGMLLNPRLCL
jgi:hypothetical protein